VARKIGSAVGATHPLPVPRQLPELQAPLHEDAPTRIEN
jgi:hypothetical protein